jgi:hypothetical protein
VSRGLAGVSVEHFLLTAMLARPLRLAGLSINTGTINDAELLARVVEHADAVCTQPRRAPPGRADRRHDGARGARSSQRLRTKRARRVRSKPTASAPTPAPNTAASR